MLEHIGLRVNMYEIIMFQLKLGQKGLITAFPHGGKGLKILVSVDFCSDNGWMGEERCEKGDGGNRIDELVDKKHTH